MAKKILAHSLCVFLSITFLCSCQRTAGETWEDTKTGGRYIGKGLREATGKHVESRQIQDYREFARTPQEDFIPLADEEAHAHFVFGDESSLAFIDADTPIPQSTLDPGSGSGRIPGIEGFSMPVGTERDVFRKIFFDTDKYDIKGKDSISNVQKIALFMKDNPDVYIFVTGNCDERGTAAYNLALGSKRSNAVRNALVKEGIHPDRIFTISYGKEKPAVIGTGPDIWQQNRRAEFKLHHN